jgi:hypothetical protein
VPNPPRGYWPGLPTSERRALKRFYRALDRRFGPFDAVAREYAKATCAAWWSARYASEAAMESANKRRVGTGRRPKAQVVDRAMKRAGLNTKTFDELMRRLEELAGGKRDLAAALRERLK